MGDRDLAVAGALVRGRPGIPVPPVQMDSRGALAFEGFIARLIVQTSSRRSSSRRMPPLSR